ncbi:DNA polymerase III subunit beta [bacterium]|nr:DNA polymerase III subunit beta [bacterium]
MRVVISQELLAGALAIAGKAVSSRTVNPVLGHIRVVADEGHLTFTGTDGDFWIRRAIAVPDATPGRVLVPAALFQALVSRLPKKPITLEVEGGQLNLSVARSTYDITVMGDENFPELPDYSGSRLCTLPAAVLKRSLLQTVFSAVKESSTGGVHYTNGVLFSFKGGRLDIVATDGHRLALRRNSGLSGIDTPDRDLLLPARVADELEKMLPDDEDAAVELYHHGNQVFFAFGAQLVASALLDVRFPDYERVIPKEIESRVHCGREELSDALARVLLVCRQKDQNPVARLSASGETLAASSEAGEIGKGTEELACEMAGKTDAEVKVALNPQYLIDALKALSGEQVTLNWISEIQPVMLTSSREPDFTYIVMPIRMD